RPLGAPLAADPAWAGRLPADPKRPGLVATGPSGILGGIPLRRGAPAPPVRAAGHRLRALRVVGARGASGTALVGPALSADLRCGRRPAPHALARLAQSQGRISDRGDARAPRRAGHGGRLGPVARAPPGRPRAAAPGPDLAGRIHPHRRAADLLPGELSPRGGANGRHRMRTLSDPTP